MSVFWLSSCDRHAQSVLAPGESPPSFALPSLAGEIKKLTDYQGKVVLLNFWASWCNPCISEMPELEALYRELRPLGFEVLSVGVEDSPQALAAVRDKLQLSFPILVDEKGVTKRPYGITGFPESFVLDRAGQLVMLLDPADKSPVVRVIGPRSWSSPGVRAQLMALLK